MFIFNYRKPQNSIQRICTLFFIQLFIFNLISPSSPIFAQSLDLPTPGTMLTPTTSFTPTIVKGLMIHRDDPLKFDFIMDTADSDIKSDVFKKESTKIIKYFLASLTLPEKDVWVNLSPYEKRRIVPQALGQTELGRDLLIQDYLLKQLTASLLYPENGLGEEFWKKVYAKATALYGRTDIPINTFNKVWIVPDKAVVYEDGNTVLIGESRLKVMLESDYLALKENLLNKELGIDRIKSSDKKQINDISSQIIKEVIIPELEKEVNEGQTFANLRQIYHAQILAVWYKRNLQESLLGKVYTNQNKIKGVDVEDKEVKQKIYKQYIEASQKGVYNYIKEDFDVASQQTIQRKYFSGGYAEAELPQKLETQSLKEQSADIKTAVTFSAPKRGQVLVTWTGVELTPDTSENFVEETIDSVRRNDTALLTDLTRVQIFSDQSNAIIQQLQQSYASKNVEQFRQNLQSARVSLGGSADSWVYTFAITAQPQLPSIPNVAELSVKEIQDRMSGVGVPISEEEALLIKERKAFKENDERLGQIFDAALKTGLLGIQFAVTNIRNFTKDQPLENSPLAYIEFLKNQVVNQYNGYLVVLLTVGETDSVLPGDGGGMASTMHAVEQVMGRQFLQEAAINFIGDGGEKTRGGNHSTWLWNGAMMTPYGVPYYRRAVQTLGKVRLQHQGFGENRVYWTASDGDYDIGELTYGDKPERELSDKDNWTMLIHGKAEDVFTPSAKYRGVYSPADINYVFAQVTQALETTNNDTTAAENLLRQDPKIVALIDDLIDEKKLTSLGENFSNAQGQLARFQEKPNAVQILELLKEFNTTNIIPNAFLVVFKRETFLKQIDLFNRITSTGKRLGEYGGSYFQTYVEGQFNPDILLSLPQEIRDLVTDMQENVLPKETILAGSLGTAGRFTDRGKTDLLSGAYLDAVVAAKANGSRGLIRRGNVTIAPNVTLNIAEGATVILENVNISSATGNPSTLTINDIVYLQNTRLILHGDTTIQKNTVMVASNIERPLDIRGGNTVLVGVSLPQSEPVLDLNPSGVWENINSLEVYPGETMVGVLTTAGRFVNRTLTDPPYKDRNIGAIVGNMEQARQEHPRLLVSSITPQMELIQAPGFRAPDGTSVPITDIKRHIDAVGMFRGLYDYQPAPLTTPTTTQTTTPAGETGTLGMDKALLKEGAEQVVETPSQVPVGGINLDPALLDLQIKRNKYGVPLPMTQQPIENMKIEGFVPVIINVTPINLPLLMGLAANTPPVQQSQREERASQQEQLSALSSSLLFSPKKKIEPAQKNRISLFIN